ncbi:hypothetical protein JCM15765_05940 [Paradesulfitobacterium aromaticivorans]
MQQSKGYAKMHSTLGLSNCSERGVNFVMVDWGLAVQIFINGVIVVMLVMGLLQISVMATSAVVRAIEGKQKDTATKV